MLKKNQTFDNGGVYGEVKPEIEVVGPFEGRNINIGDLIKNRKLVKSFEPDQSKSWWSAEVSAEICTVCGQRPIGYPKKGSIEEASLELEKWADRDKAESRKICRICLQRRGRRAKDWTRNIKDEAEQVAPFDRTIWLDEAIDSSGRFALIVGQFNLEGWLDGKLIPTMLKSAFFARIRRCWDTTFKFWEQVMNEDIPSKLKKSKRICIQPIDATSNKKQLGKGHSYEIEVDKQRIGVCWDPNDDDTEDRNVFWTTSNLEYCSKNLGISLDELKTRIKNQKLILIEPGGYLGQDRKIGDGFITKEEIIEIEYSPFIPLVHEPVLFMAIVPADQAIAVVQGIKDKYDLEMARVRDRLPLNIGLIFAPRSTPIRAVLDAARSMLEMPNSWEKWNIATNGRTANVSLNGQAFIWNYPEKMSDDNTPDVWYPHLLKIDPTTKAVLEKDSGDFLLVDNLNGTVFIRPSRFDFEFLDVAGRRFEIYYDQNGKRPGRTCRPYLLDELKTIEAVWDLIKDKEKGLTNSQITSLLEIIEKRRKEWKITTPDDPVFKTFVIDAVRESWGKKGWQNINDSHDLLINAATSGMLADVVELYMKIMKQDSNKKGE